MFIIKSLLLLLVIGAAVFLAWLNPGDITVNYGIGHGEYPISYLAGGVFVIGTVFGYLVASFSVLKWRTTAHRWKSKAESALSEVDNLRRLPLKNQ